jgi:CheY-like chemotaxis protein
MVTELDRQTPDGAAAAPGSRRVIVVDDDHDAAAALAALLEANGHEAVAVFDGADAIARGASFIPDIVFLDLSMPIMSGYDAVALIRRQDWGRSVRLIALTGWDDPATKEKALDAGFEQVLVKPLQVELLMDAL